MREYEIMYILSETLDDETRKGLVDTLHAIITDANGEIKKVDEWGLRDFAYEINKSKKGYYVVTTVAAPSTAIDEFDRISRINSNVIRHLVISLEDQK